MTASADLKILILEDSETDFELTERALRRGELRYVSRRALDEPTFVHELAAFEPDIVLADYRLPSFDGLTALRIVKEQSPETPFIIVSGTLGDEKAVEVLKLGATDYVLKDRLHRLIPAILRAQQDVLDRMARRDAERQLEQSRRIESLGRMAMTIAHEFNNVLMAIQSAVGILQASTAQPTVAREVQRIDKAVKRGKRVTQEVMRFASPAEPALQRIDVGAWIDAFVDDIRGVVGERVAIDLFVASNDLRIMADAHQLEQVFTNLALNAADAMHKVGRIELTVDRELIADRSYVHVSFRDGGAGMTPEVLARIFEPLYTTKRSGTGLGLTVAHQVIAAHGGQISAESIVGEGTTFHVLLPE